MRPLYRGDTRTIKVTIQDEAGLPVSIVGHALWVTFKKSLNDPDPGLLQVSEIQPDNADTQAGKGSVTLTSTVTDLLPVGMTYYDVQWVQPGSPQVVKTVASRRVRVKADVTRSIA